LRHERYIEVLRRGIEVYAEVRSIQRKNLENYNVVMTKKALSSFCDKRFQLCPIRSVPHGYRGPEPQPAEFFNVPHGFIIEKEDEAMEM
jgi:hypothetical protein